MMPKQTTSSPYAVQSLGIFALLMLAIFDTEMAVMEFFAPLFARMSPASASLLDAAILSFIYAVPLWFFFINPLSRTEEAEPLFAPAWLLAKALAIIFVVEFIVMLFLLEIQPQADIHFRNMGDACLTILFCTPLLWCLLFRPAMRKSRVSLDDLLGTPLKLYVLLLLMVFLVDLLQEELVHFFSPGIELFSNKITESFLTTLISAPFLWWFIARPLKLTAQSEKFRADAICGQVIDAIVIVDGQGVIESFNTAAENIFGYPAGEITGKPAGLLFNGGEWLPDALAREAAGDDKKLPSKALQVLGLRRDGTALTMDVSCSRVLLDGKPKFLVIMRDVSDRVEIENALRDSEELFRSLSESAPTGVFQTDPSGRCLYTNRRWREITGLTPAEALGEGWAQALHPEDRENVFKAWNQSVAEGREFFGEFRFRLPWGEVRWVQARAAALRSRDGDVIGYVGTDDDITERKQIELCLRSSLSLLTSTLESTADGVLVIDGAHNVQIFNQKFLDMWRFSRQFMENSNSHQLTAQVREQLEDPDEFAARIEELYSKPEVTGLDIIRFKDGRVFERYSQPRLLEGEIAGRVLSYRDITIRTHAEEALRRSEERFDILVNGANDGIWDWNLQTGVLYCTSRFEELLGYREGELTYDSEMFASLLHPEDYERFREDIDSHLQKQVAYDSEYRLRTVAGHYRWFRVRGQAVRDGSGQAVRIIGSISDITKRKEAEEALRDSETRFRQIFEQSEDAIIFFKPGTCSIIDVNATAEKLYGYAKAELVQVGLGGICTAEDLVRLSRIICGIGRGESSFLDKVANLRKDGTQFIVSMRGKVMTLQGVDIIYCTFRDISERVRMEEEALEIQAKLFQANKMTSLGLMVSGVAHEINNPNNFIMANSQFLAMAWEDAIKVLTEYYRDNGEFFVGGIPFSELGKQAPQLMAGIIDGARRINEIVNNLKKFARQDKIVAGREVDVNQVVTTAVSILHHELVKHTENFHLDLAQNVPHVQGSNQQLGQVIINLVMNACQALPDKRCGIWVATAFDAPTGQVIITVRDEGGGMSRDVSSRIMEPFFTTKLDSGGTGLGLSISHSIVKEHNGSMGFESEPGKGTTFIVRIPAGRPAAREGTA